MKVLKKHRLTMDTFFGMHAWFSSGTRPRRQRMLSGLAWQIGTLEHWTFIEARGRGFMQAQCRVIVNCCLEDMSDALALHVLRNTMNAASEGNFWGQSNRWPWIKCLYNSK